MPSLRSLAALALVFCSFLSPQNSIRINDFPLFLLVFGIFLDGQKTSKSMPKTFRKIYLTPPKIRAKTLPKSTPVRSKIEVWRGLRFKLRFCRVLGAAWGRPGAVLGLLGAVLGASWGRLGASWERLGSVFGRLGAVLGCLGGILGTSWGAFHCQFDLKAVFDRFCFPF